MPVNANPLPTAPSSRNAREFLAVCARHNLPYGDLNCLPALLRELHSNKHFAMHFWSAVAGMTEKQSADTGTVLAAVVEAVTGRTPAEVREAGPANRILLDRLERLLAGQDVAPEEIPDMEPPPKAAAAPLTEAAEPVEDVLPIRRVLEPKRRGRQRRSNNQTAKGSNDQPAVPISTPAPTRDESVRLVLMPEPEPVAATIPTLPAARVPRATPRPAVVPLSSYEETEPRRSAGATIVFGAIAAVILAGGGYVLARGGVGQTLDRIGFAVRAGYDSAIATWKGQPAQSPPATPAPVSTSAQPAPAPAAAASSTSAPQPAVLSPAPPAANKPSAPSATSSGELTPAQRMAVVAAMNEQHDPIPDESAPAPVAVPEGTMNSRLITSRVPVLPDDVRAKGITGVVRMQAIINRNGFVSRLHVLQGPTELRHPALDAVSSWRYRPYMVNGQPADVTTTITVDFSSIE
ncbi:MAG TPA: TonB family protein [Acidobacteriaceae bacterium]|jgi:protein TonB|nr:TonB family protein [Acidobacteriaceae bacterium]